jgi:hypothetical protein
MSTPENVVEVSVANPNAEETAALVASLTTESTTAKAVEFKFKKSVDSETGITTIRKPVILTMPYPNLEGVINILQGSAKGLELLNEAIESVINDAARVILADTSLTAATFPYDKVSWEAIANQPKSERKGALPKELWIAFAVDYSTVMVEAAGKTEAQVAKAVAILIGKFQAVKTNKPVLSLLTEQLAVYINNTEKAEEFTPIVSFLLDKADQYLNATDAELLEAL